jgi:hypothetical protein
LVIAFSAQCYPAAGEHEQPLLRVWMTITVEILEGLLDHVVRAGQDPARAAIALEGYRSDRLSEADVRQLPEHDCAVARHLADRARIERRGDLPGERHAG